MKFVAFALIALIAIFLLASSTAVVHAAAKRPQQPVAPTPVKKTSCDTCQFIVTYLENVLNSTEKNIEQEMLLLCDMVPSQFKPICKSAVQIYLPTLIKLIASKDPKEACCWLSTKIYPFCEAETCAAYKFDEHFDQKLLIGLANRPTVATKPEAFDACSTCKLAVSVAENSLKNGTLRNELKQLIQKRGCPLIPDPYKESCQMIVEVYFDILLNNLLESFGPEKICGSIGLCPKQAPAATLLFDLTAAASSLSDKDVNGMGCPLCKGAIGVIEGYLKSAETREAVKQFILTQGCQALPPNYAGLCKVMVEANFDQIVENLLQKFTAEAVCQQLKLCPKQMDLNMFLTEKQKANLCTVCPIAVMYLENLLLSKNAEIQAFLKTNVCQRIPNQIAVAACISLVDTQYEKLVQQFLEKYNPTVVCKAIGCN